MSIPRVQSKSSPTADERSPALHVVTFGCQMNKYDSLAVEGRFSKRGYRTTDSIADADVVLFNTCSVREHAEERVYSWVGDLKREKARRPGLVVGVMGCMAERVGEELFGRAPVVDLVVGTRSFQHLPELVDEVRARRESGDAARIAKLGLDEYPDGAREGEAYTGGKLGYLTVMRGCDLNCTFCIVPRVRGRVLSRPIDELVREARWMVDSGAQVITLLGQTVNSYGEDLPADPSSSMRGRQGRPSLADLIQRLNELDGLERIRLVTLHPSYVTRALAEALRDCSKCDRFLPLPAQSGSDAVLKRMKRGYTTDLYRRRADLLRVLVP
jgi:tRNA-2-methylthio-N6-dimethylallyladenosine synthase